MDFEGVWIWRVLNFQTPESKRVQNVHPWDGAPPMVPNVQQLTPRRAAGPGMYSAYSAWE